MNLAEGYLGRAPPDIVRSAMPSSVSSRSLYSGTDGAQVGPYEDHKMTPPEEHINGIGGTWPKQVQGHSNAKYLDIPLDSSATFRLSTVPPSRSTRFLSQSMESPLWIDGRPDSARDPFASVPHPPTITVQDFSAVPTPPGFFQHNTRHASPSEQRRPGPFVTTSGAGPQNNEGSLRSPLMNDRRHGAASPASHQGPFYATSYDHPHQMIWDNTTERGGGVPGFRSGTMHAISNGTGAAAETGTGECYTRVTQQLMRDSENFPHDQVHPAMSQTRYVPQQSANYVTTVKSLKAMLAFPPHGHGSSSPGEDSRNSDNFGYASVNKVPHLWRNHMNPVGGGGDLSGSGDSRGSNRTSTQGYSPDTSFTARLTDNTSRELYSNGTHLDTAAGERNSQPRPQHYFHDRNFSEDRSVSRGDTSLPHDRSFSQDISNTSHDESFSSNRNQVLAHDRSFSNDDPRGAALGKRIQLNGAGAQVDGPFLDPRGTAAGKRTQLTGTGALLGDQVLHRWMTPFDDTTMTSEPVPKDQGYRSRFINEVLSSKYGGRGGNDKQEDLVSSGGLTEMQTEGARSTTNNGGKAMMGEHRKWIQMEDRLLIRIYELQKERSQLTVKVEELAVENRGLSRKFKDAAGQLERKSLEMENVRRQLRERIADMTSTISTPQDSTPPPSSFHQDAPHTTTTSSNQRRCHDDDDDARRGRQMAQEELAACQIRFARDRERWMSEKTKVLRYQQLLQQKYEQVVAENQVLKEQAGIIGKELCQNTTQMRSAMTQQRLTLLKDGPSGLSFDSVC